MILIVISACRRRPAWRRGLWLQTDRDQVGLKGETAHQLQGKMAAKIVNS
jgi:hypothetical protein